VSLPADVRHPESITSDTETREIYVATFDARMPENERNNQLLRYSEDGRLLSRRSFGATPLTGIEFRDGYVYVLNFGASKLQRVPGRFHAGSEIEDIASFRAPSCQRNDMQALRSRNAGERSAIGNGGRTTLRRQWSCAERS
jgi:hypothetical protein